MAEIPLALDLAPSPRFRRGREQLCSVRRGDALARSRDEARGRCQGARQARARGSTSFRDPSEGRSASARVLERVSGLVGSGTAHQKARVRAGAPSSAAKSSLHEGSNAKSGSFGEPREVRVDSGSGVRAAGARVQPRSAVHPRVFTVRFPSAVAAAVSSSRGTSIACLVRQLRAKKGIASAAVTLATCADREAPTRSAVASSPLFGFDRLLGPGVLAIGIHGHLACCSIDGRLERGRVLSFRGPIRLRRASNFLAGSAIVSPSNLRNPSSTRPRWDHHRLVE